MAQFYKNRYRNLPPNARTNFIKLRSPTPFHCAWDLLIRDWINLIDDKKIHKFNYKVLRNKKHLRELREVVNKPQTFNFSIMKKLMDAAGENCLIPVVIDFVKKGKPTDLALICLPKKEDLLSGKEPEEKIHSDINKKKINENIRDEEQNHVKEPLPIKREENTRDTVEESSSSKNSKKESDWVPNLSELNNIINFPSRTLMGYVTVGDFGLSSGNSSGLGYVSILSLFEIIKMVNECNSTSLKVLVKNPTQRNYKFAKLTVPEE